MSHTMLGALFRLACDESLPLPKNYGASGKKRGYDCNEKDHNSDCQDREVMHWIFRSV